MNPWMRSPGFCKEHEILLGIFCNPLFFLWTCSSYQSLSNSNKLLLLCKKIQMRCSKGTVYEFSSEHFLNASMSIRSELKSVKQTVYILKLIYSSIK